MLSAPTMEIMQSGPVQHILAEVTDVNMLNTGLCSLQYIMYQSCWG